MLQIEIIIYSMSARVDPTDLLGGKFWPREPNLPPFSTFSKDFGHFILKRLIFDICFYFMFIFIFS